jgi:hydroxymethylglutaryl-CoA lyase
MTDCVKVVEVGPRDGLQNERQPVSAAVKIELIEKLAACGLPVVEATSFVAARWIPQLADAAEVLAGFQRRCGTSYPVLIPNRAGLERALDAGVRQVAVFTSASNAFNRKNINCDIAESLRRIEPVAALAKQRRLGLRGYLSCALGCPYEGTVPLNRVVRVARALRELGCHEIAISDTIGVGTPGALRQVIRAIAAEMPVNMLAVHLHDTRGQALTNVYASLEEGIRIIDASVAGLGGCPYAAGAAGNLATEDLVYLLHGEGLFTGIDLPALVEVAQWIARQLGREPAGRLSRASLPAWVQADLQPGAHLRNVTAPDPTAGPMTASAAASATRSAA